MCGCWLFSDAQFSKGHLSRGHFPGFCIKLSRSAPCSTQTQTSPLAPWEEALEVMLFAISRVFPQADPLQLSNLQPLESDTETQQAASTFLELSADEGLCSLELERLLCFSFLAIFTLQMRAGRDLQKIMGERVKVPGVSTGCTQVPASWDSCNGLRAAILEGRRGVCPCGHKPSLS